MRSRRWGWAVVLAALAVIVVVWRLVAGVEVDAAHDPEEVLLASGAAESSRPSSAPAETTTDRDRGPEDRLPSPGNQAFLALVIDDLGRSLEQVEALQQLGVPLSYAVLPFEPQTSSIVGRLVDAGEEVIVHLPMEPDGAADPGPGALRRGMSSTEIESLTDAAIAAVPGAVGVNNHMGSALSADSVAMTAVLGSIGRRQLFFLDSRTSAESVGFEVARRLGVPAAARNVFLDVELDQSAIEEQFRRFLEVAGERGAAVAIGHPHPETLEVLQRLVPQALERGFVFVPVSYLLERSGGDVGDAMEGP